MRKHGLTIYRKFPALQEEISYSLSMKGISYPFPVDAVRKLILERSEAEGDKLAVWSRAIGRNQTYLQQFITKNSPKVLAQDDREALGRVMGIDPELLRGYSGKRPNLPAKAKLVKPQRDDFRFIGAYNQGAAAGPGSYIDDGPQVPMYHLAFRNDWIREITSAPDDLLFVLFADGNSMSPTIHHGDTMLVDKSQRNPRKDGIFVFMWDGFLNVKRLTSDPSTRTISITSDNPVHPPFPGAKPDTIDVIGRVIWIGRKV